MCMHQERDMPHICWHNFKDMTFFFAHLEYMNVFCIFGMPAGNTTRDTVVLTINCIINCINYYINYYSCPLTIIFFKSAIMLNVFLPDSDMNIFSSCAFFKFLFLSINFITISRA